LEPLIKPASKGKKKNTPGRARMHHERSGQRGKRNEKKDCPATKDHKKDSRSSVHRGSKESLKGNGMMSQVLAPYSIKINLKEKKVFLRPA